MSDEMVCPYEKICKELYKESEIDKPREKCDCVNCVFCDYYWLIYDKRIMEKINM